ncbi:MAG: hypothetical protein KF784_15850 [Fimbriimonadaceae bacterium]|nr:hypothetical protein [Fimbriimonadaceae bacterium]
MTQNVGVTLLAIFQLNPDGLQLFDQHEDAVLPLLQEHGGELQRRVRSLDDTVEVHLVWFPSEQAFEAFRDDPRRTKVLPLMQMSKVEASIHPVREVPTSR